MEKNIPLCPSTGAPISNRIDKTTTHRKNDAIHHITAIAVLFAVLALIVIIPNETHAAPMYQPDKETRTIG